ncbi:unnamed protein product [Lampetra planeri]
MESGRRGAGTENIETERLHKMVVAGPARGGGRGGGGTKTTINFYRQRSKGEAEAPGTASDLPRHRRRPRPGNRNGFPKSHAAAISARPIATRPRHAGRVPTACLAWASGLVDGACSRGNLSSRVAAWADFVESLFLGLNCEGRESPALLGPGSGSNRSVASKRRASAAGIYGFSWGLLGSGLTPAVTESNGVSSEQSGLEPDTSTDIEVTYKTVSTENDLVDWSKPLLWQVGHLREKYDEWVHQPVDRHIRLFGSDLVESWTKTSWYVVPSVWLPVVLLWSVWCNRELARGDTALHPPLLTSVSVTVGQEWFPFLFLLGMFIWSFVEYSLHRFLFHMTPPANNYYLITLHFLLHGQHHKSPFDGSRLVFPPLPASLFVALFYIGFRLALPSAVTGSLMVGGLAGYVIYDLTHYYLHYGAPRRGTYLYHLKAYHVKHHFEHQKLGFGITSKLWDFPFQTLIPKETFEKSH